MQINTYLLFNGECEQAMNFYRDALGGKIESIMHYREAPMPTDNEHKDQVIHGVLIVDGTKIMFSDAHGPRVGVGNNFAVSLNLKSDGEFDRVFDAISTGGTVTAPPADVFWGAKFAMCTDKFGVNWMFTFEKPKK